MEYIKLYHLSLELQDVTIEFCSRIPEAIMIGENQTIPRVCASLSIYGALSAVPWGGGQLDSIFKYHEKNIVSGEIHEEVQIRVYEFFVSVDKVIFPEELFQKNYVEDAIETRECWITEDVMPGKVYDIFLSEWGKESFDRMSYQDTLKLVDGVDYDEVWSGQVGTKITDVIFSLKNSKVAV